MGAIRELRVQNFRSIYDSRTVELKPGITPLIGPNGVGKSNTLWALSLLSDDEPIDGGNIHSREDTPLGLIEVLNIKLDSLHEEKFPFVNPPFTFDDLSMDPDPSLTPNLIVSDYLNQNAIRIKKYANGRRVVDFPSAKKAPSLDIFEFTSARVQDHLDVTNSVIRFILDEGYVEIDNFEEPDTLKELIEQLGEIVEQLDQIVKSDELREAERDLISSYAEDIQLLFERTVEFEEQSRDVDHVIPPVIDARSLFELEDEVHIEEYSKSQVLRGLLALEDIPPDGITSIEEDICDVLLERSIPKLEEYLNGFWEMTEELSKQVGRTFPEDIEEKYELQGDISHETLKLEISEDGSKPVPLKDASKGVQWIIRFILQVVTEVGNKRRDASIFILDDVGEHLHPGAQALLLETLKSISAGNQVIYSTHSPFLLDIDQISNIRFVHWNADSGTTLNDRVSQEDGQIDSWRPVRSALGVEVAQMPFASSSSILLEGYSELTVLSEINTMFRLEGGRFSVSKNVNFIDFSGSQAGPIVNFLRAEGFDFVVLVDDDEGGHNTRRALEKHDVDLDKVKTISELVDFDPITDNPSLEDVFGVDLFIRAVLDLQPTDIEFKSFKQDIEDELQGQEDPDFSRVVIAKISEIGGRGDFEVVTDKRKFAEKAVQILNAHGNEYPEVLDRLEELLESLQTELETSE